MDDVKAWALKQGNSETPGETEDGRDCQFTIAISGSEKDRRIYVSLGQKLNPKGQMVYMGGFVRKSDGSGEFQRSGQVRAREVQMEFTGQEFDEQGRAVPNVRSQLRLERPPNGEGFLKAIGSSTLWPKEIVCRFPALVS